MDPGSIAAIIVSIVAAGGAYLSQKAAAKAAKENAAANVAANKDSAKSDAEKDAYERARKMDIETQDRQNREIAELIEENRLIRVQNAELIVVKEQNGYLNADVKRIARDNQYLLTENERLHLEVEKLRSEVRRLSQRSTDTNPMMPEARSG